MTTQMQFRLHVTNARGEKSTVDLGATTTLGRQAGNDIRLDDQRVSRQHAAIACSGDGCSITDLDSSNGTYVDGELLTPRAPVPLEPGEEVAIGSFRLTLERVDVEVREAEESERQARGLESEAEESGPDVPDPTGAEHRGQDVPSATRGAGGDGAGASQPPPGDDLIPPGLGLRSRKLLDYLPGIYHTEFMARFLGIFEAILTPIEWTIDNFDLYLDPGTAPESFLPWLANWFDITFDATWSDAQRRQLLKEAHKIYARRGTRWALSRVLEIYTSHKPEIIDTGEDLDPFTFRVTLPRRARPDRAMIERLIDAHKPAHTLYSLHFKA